MKLRLSIVLVVAVACGGNGTSSDAGTDAAVVNGCTIFADLTAGGGTINFPADAAPAQYEPNCARIKATQTLTWSGSFVSHPLVPLGGDSPNPIQPTSTGTNKSFSFATPGTFGFGCGIHSTMRGAIQVVP